MENVAYKVRQFYEDGKAYFTKETPFKDRHAFHKRQEEHIHWNIKTHRYFIIIEG